MLKKEQIEYLDDIPFNQFRYNTQQNVFERNALGKDEVGNIIEEIEQLSLVFDKDILTFTLKRAREWVERMYDITTSVKCNDQIERLQTFWKNYKKITKLYM